MLEVEVEEDGAVIAVGPELGDLAVFDNFKVVCDPVVEGEL